MQDCIDLNCDSVIIVLFYPTIQGPHAISVMMNGDEPVGGSPFICNIYDVSKVLVSGLGPSKVILDAYLTSLNFLF